MSLYRGIKIVADVGLPLGEIFTLSPGEIFTFTHTFRVGETCFRLIPAEEWDEARAAAVRSYQNLKVT